MEVEDVEDKAGAIAATRAESGAADCGGTAGVVAAVAPITAQVAPRTTQFAPMTAQVAPMMTQVAITVPPGAATGETAYARLEGGRVVGELASIERGIGPTALVVLVGGGALPRSRRPARPTAAAAWRPSRRAG